MKKKKHRIQTLKTFPNVSEEPDTLKGKWHSEVFKNDQPITLELGCGKGDFIVELARMYPQRNFVGVDLKGARLFIGAQKGLTQELDNLFFIRFNILNLDEVFQPNDVSEAWITFPDPYPKKPRKRMTHQRFIEMYRRICVPNADFHLKTDDDELFAFSEVSVLENGCTIRQQSADLYSETEWDDKLYIQTTFEKRHLAEGKTIKYLHFQL